MVNSTKKIFKGISVECMESLNEDAKKERGQIQYIAGRNHQIATNAKLFDITHEFYGFNAELTEAIN